MDSPSHPNGQIVPPVGQMYLASSSTSQRWVLPSLPVLSSFLCCPPTASASATSVSTTTSGPPHAGCRRLLHRPPRQSSSLPLRHGHARVGATSSCGCGQRRRRWCRHRGQGGVTRPFRQHGSSARRGPRGRTPPRAPPSGSCC